MNKLLLELFNLCFIMFNMNYESLKKRLGELKTEELIWIVYIGIIIFSFYSNSLERDYLINNNLESRDKYRNTLIIIFSILIIVYTYFLKESIEDIRNLKSNDNERRKVFVYLSFIASLLIAISGAIFLFIAINDEDIEVELAFN